MTMTNTNDIYTITDDQFAKIRTIMKEMGRDHHYTMSFLKTRQHEQGSARSTTYQYETSNKDVVHFKAHIHLVNDASLHVFGDGTTDCPAVIEIIQNIACPLTGKFIVGNHTSQFHYLSQKLWNAILDLLEDRKPKVIKIVPVDFIAAGYKAKNERLPTDYSFDFRKKVKNEKEGGTKYTIRVETHDFRDKTKYPGASVDYMYTLSVQMLHPDHMDDFTAHFHINMHQTDRSIKEIEQSIETLWTKLNCASTD